MGTGWRYVVCLVSRRLRSNNTRRWERSGALHQVALLVVDSLARRGFSFVSFIVFSSKRNTHAWIGSTPLEMAIGTKLLLLIPSWSP